MNGPRQQHLTSSELRALLADEGLRRRLASAGRAHVMARHTYADRLELLLQGRGYTST